MAQQEDSSGGPLIGLEASRKISQRLASSARKLRFSTSSRSNLYKVVGLRPRLTDRLFTAAILLISFLFFAVPNITVMLYYGFFASDQYESETRFTVRSSAPALGKDQIAKVTGVPSAKIVQDTQIVTNFIESHEMLDMLRKRDIDLKQFYGKSNIDWWARLSRDSTAEEMKKYWEDMVATSVSPSSGIVTVKVKAFSPGEAALLVGEIVKASEIVVNQVNNRMWKDVIATAEINLENAKQQLQKARETVTAARNREGVLSVGSSSQIISTLIGTIEEERLKLQQQYNSQLAAVSPKSPQMRVLQREISSKEQQIADLNAQLAGTGKERNLADVSQDLSQLELAQTLAEQQFSSSVRTLEQVRFISKQQLLYLDSFLAPRVPDEANYPKRLLWISGTLIASLVAWATAASLLYLGRSRLMH
ncbi:capsule biosynthesis protein [Rhizobium pusense]|uniref:capsule biosynthesis protein n=1 Tax=Agrobacterium pusense TaxID=648995 RepID=UPI000D19DE48|nr:capsule biosynthesis protein [Agrobacterium pusense]MDH0910462.1 capsule biosynthesis protein [Agrobacterium pusense]MDH1098423.1 capsule biosynthesis protein [Agrobacterium pusense]MDH1114533.1 capsule biosynthesis protein [Agrobacterium pusense]MDH2195703.1 capsule biosynthesis protein [Agrobacterium pusense]